MEFNWRIEGDLAVVEPAGRITIGEPAEALQRAVQAAREAGARSLLIDCSRVPFADSSGIGELLAAMRAAREAGGAVALFGPRGKLHEILEITKLSGLFVIAPTEQEARRRLRDG